MKSFKYVLLTIVSFLCFFCLTANSGEEKVERIFIHVNDEVLICECADNTSSGALMDKLKAGDLNLDMSDYGGFEKVADLGFSLPQNNEPMHTSAGDVILYLGKTFSIYYGQNSWNLTRIGKITNKNEAELKSILGNSDISIRLSLKQ
ncbi:MAG: cyclophilin-like fold protein [Succinivibrio dextrinosolvens]|nr:cyclophilin-like fold protein [Succinivibrio dextrinosolvens]